MKDKKFQFIKFSIFGALYNKSVLHKKKPLKEILILEHNIYNHKITYFNMKQDEKKETEPDNKEEVLKTRDSRKLYIPIYTMILILILTISFAKFSGKEVNDLGFKAALIFSGIAIFSVEIHRIINRYEINGQSLIHRKGIFVQTIKRVDLIAVSDADSKQNLWQKFFRYGDVSVHLFSRDSSIQVKSINDPSKFVIFLERKMNEKRAKGIGGGMSG